MAQTARQSGSGAASVSRLVWADAKTVVVGKTSNGFTLAEPNDCGVLEKYAHLVNRARLGTVADAEL